MTKIYLVTVSILAKSIVTEANLLNVISTNVFENRAFIFRARINFDLMQKTFVLRPFRARYAKEIISSIKS